uniref:Uncharacterized protein n=1 Tax=Zea mays TaxID=4577 RepID=A0A804LE49_MAIZE
MAASTMVAMSSWAVLVAVVLMQCCNVVIVAARPLPMETPAVATADGGWLGMIMQTTTTSSLAASLSLARLGLLAVDADLHNLDLLLGFKNRVHLTAANVLAGDCPLDQAFVRHRVLHPRAPFPVSLGPAAGCPSHSDPRHARPARPCSSSSSSVAMSFGNGGLAWKAT